MKTKACSKCGVLYPMSADFFYRERRNDDGLRNDCKKCKDASNDRWRNENVDRVKANREEYMQRPEIKARERAKERDRYKDQDKRRKRQDRVNAYRGSSRHARVRNSIGERLRQIFISGMCSKNTESIIGCTKQEFIVHIKSQFTDGMNLGNYGKTGWTLDHIKPAAAFDLTDDSQLKEYANYSNTRPLWFSDNASKGAVYNGVDYRDRSHLNEGRKTVRPIEAYS